MFSANDGYKFTYKTSKQANDGDLIFLRHIYTFKSRKKQSYIVYVDQYSEIQVCAVKFFLKSHRHSPKKYQLKTGLHEMPGLISTCVNIMLDMYAKNKSLSFGFIGANDENESVENTKRFRLYRAIMIRIFTPAKFKHLAYTEKSAYLMLNRENEQSKPSLQSDVETFFRKYYVI